LPSQILRLDCLIFFTILCLLVLNMKCHSFILRVFDEKKMKIKSVRKFLLVPLVVLVFGLVPQYSQAQAVDDEKKPVPLNVTSDDNDAAQRAIANGYYSIKIMPNMPNAKSGTDKIIHRSTRTFHTPEETAAAKIGAAASSNVPSETGQVQWYGGPVLSGAQEINIYVNCPANNESCWGTPEKFENDLGNSSFLHVADQYVGPLQPGAFYFAKSLTVQSTLNYYGFSDIASLVHSAAVSTGANGLGTVFHVFLAPGIDTCAGSTCYAPDGKYTFNMCAYHSDTYFSDTGELIFTVEPYQNVSGCVVPAGSPNGALIDSTANLLSHEFFETITDPELNAWYGSNGLSSEIGDLCAWNLFEPTLASTTYEIQKEYSDAIGGCATSVSAVNGECGSAAGTSFPIVPSSNLLCSVGLATAVTSNPTGTAWSWGCNGIDGGINNSCSAVKIPVVNGICGAANGGTFMGPPTTNLCSSGTPTAIYPQSGTYYWTCAGNNNQSVQCSAKAQPSANGTTMPNASLIVDAIGNSWTQSGGNFYLNGLIAPSTIKLLLYYNNSIYSVNTGNVWYHYASNGTGPTGGGPAWVGVASNPEPPSASGTTTTRSGASLVDGSGIVWTVGGTGLSYENGIADGGANITLLLYYNGVIYANTNGYGWFSHTSGKWTSIAGDPRATTIMGLFQVTGQPQVYYSNGTQYCWIQNGTDFNNDGFSWSNIVPVSAIPSGLTNAGTCTVPPFKTQTTITGLFQVTGQPQVYYSNGTQYCWIQNGTDFNNDGFSWSNIVPVSAIPSGLTNAGTCTVPPFKTQTTITGLFQVTGQPQVYYSNGTQYCWIQNGTDFNNDGFSWSNIVPVPAIPSGLTNAGTCTVPPFSGSPAASVSTFK